MESRKEFIRRIGDFLKFVLDQKKTIGQTVIAVTHGGTITFIYHLLLGTDLNEVPYIHNAAAHVFNLKRFPLEPYSKGAINEFVKQKKRGKEVK